MRSLVLAASLALASGCKSPPAPAKVYDLSTQEARAAAVLDAAGIEEKRICGCVRDADNFSGVVLVGSGCAYDSGCFAKGYFANGVYVAAREDARAALGDAWGHPYKREAVARMWLADAFEVSLVEKPDSTVPVVGRDSAGGLVFEGWNPGSLTSTGCFTRYRVTVSPAARFALETFEGFRGERCY